MRDTCQRKRAQMNNRKYQRQQQELEDRQAHIAVPHPGQRELRALGRRRRVPCGRVERHVMAPDDQDADAIHEGDEQHLGEHRVAQPKCRRDGGIEPRHGAFGDQIAFQELLHHETHAPVHDKLGNDQQGHRHQEADVNFQVQQERHGRAPAQQLPFQSGEHQERQPGKQRDDDNTPPHQPQRIVGQMRPTQKLEERPAQDEREVLRIRGENSAETPALFAGRDHTLRRDLKESEESVSHHYLTGFLRALTWVKLRGPVLHRTDLGSSASGQNH